MAVALPLLMCSLALGGLGVVNIGDRTPALLAADVFLGVLAYLVGIRWLTGARAAYRDRMVGVLAGTCIGAQFLSLLVNGSDLYKGLLSIKILGTGWLAYAVSLALVRSRQHVRLVFAGIIALPTLISVLLISQFALFSWEGDSPDKDLIRLAFGGSNYLASFMVIGIPAALGVVMTCKRWAPRALSGSAAALMTVGLLLTLSRGGAFALAVSLGVVAPVLLGFRSGVRYLFLFVGVSALMILVVAPRVLPTYWTKGLELTTYRLEYPDKSRVELLGRAANDFLAHPILGIGPLQSQAVDSGGTPHNFVLQSFAELGLAGAIPFLSIIGVFLVRAARTVRRARPSGGNVELAMLFAGVTGSLIHGLFELTFQGAEYAVFFFTSMSVVSIEYWSSGVIPPHRALPVELAQPLDQNSTLSKGR